VHGPGLAFPDVWAVWVVIAIVALIALVGSITKAQQRAQHRDLCAHCGAKLKFGFLSNRYDPKCPACHRPQPWAPLPPVTPTSSCPSGHPVIPSALFCPTCGQPMAPPM